MFQQHPASPQQDDNDSTDYDTCDESELCRTIADSSDSEDADSEHAGHSVRHSRLQHARGSASLFGMVGSNATGAHAGVPTEQANAEVLTAGDSRDWTVPLHPNVRNQRRRLSGPMRAVEWAQMHFMLEVLNAAELETGTTLAYSYAVLHFTDFLTRYSLEAAFSVAHRASKAVFTAVWSAAQIEQVLIHFVLHEAAVRGNGWSSVRGKLYGIRHHNVRHGCPNPLEGKLRLKQVMRALKKYRGPGAGKKPVDRAVLLMMEKMLQYDTDDDDLVFWAAALCAWHFMMRGAEYTAKRSNRRFDLDKVI